MTDDPENESVPDGPDVGRWREELEEKRAEKDEFFAEHPQSPTPLDERDDFSGLAYFDPDFDYRVTATVERHDEPEVVRMETTAGGEMRYLRVATLAFEIPDAAGDAAGCELHGYRQEGAEGETLFVPFRDKTTGQQTYAGGRYVELTADRELVTGDEIVLDFNLAYAPFCAYSDTFDCPLPPEGNWLEVAIPAGERTP